MTDIDKLVAQLRDLIDNAGYRYNDKFPPERELCKKFGTTRTQLRHALAELEAQGRIWRHVGRGTFVGARPVLNLQDLSYLRDQIKPEQVMAVRLSIEPELCRLAARNAAKSDHDQLRLCHDNCCTSVDWRNYEAWDNNLHFAIARATRNQLFLYFFETLNSLRRSVVWAQPRTTSGPPADYASFHEHSAIVEGIISGDGEGAAAVMTRHLNTVHARLNKAPPKT